MASMSKKRRALGMQLMPAKPRTTRSSSPCFGARQLHPGSDIRPQNGDVKDQLKLIVTGTIAGTSA